MRALSNLKGRWNPQRMCIEFTWDVAGLGNDRFIYIFPLFEQNESKRIDMRRYIVHDIADMRQGSLNSAVMRLDGAAQIGVNVHEFCAFSKEEMGVPEEMEIINSCLNCGGYVISVMVGYAEVEYSLTQNSVGNATVIEIELCSSSNISKGVLGYQYRCDSLVIKEKVPVALPKGTRVMLPAIMIPSDSDFKLIPFDERFSGNVILQPKKKKTIIEKMKGIW